MSRKVAFITGSAKRIGACTAKHLHQLGFNIVIHCHHSRGEALALMDELNTLRIDSCKLVEGDICELNTLELIAQQAQQAFGRLDVLINNASSFYPTPMGSITPLNWQQLVGSNMQAPLFLSQFCLKQLKENHGVIVNMLDIHAERPLNNHTLYCMAKAALVSMTKSLAVELAPEIRVVGVAPGAILWPEQTLQEEDKQQVLQQIPAKRMGTPEDIAQAIVFLVQASYVTGHILTVDGGRSQASMSKA
jgi:pteridine reductase